MRQVKRRMGVLAIIATAALAGCMTREASRPPRSANEIISAQDVVLTVRLQDDVRLMQLGQELQADYPVAFLAEWPLRSLDVHCLIFRVGENHDADEIIARLNADGRVESAQPMQTFTVRTSDYNDELLALQAGFRELDAVLAHRFATGKGVRLALIDTGVDRHHPDLSGRVAVARDFVGDAGGEVVAEIHGTGMAGVIAAQGNNGIGIVGIAPDVELMALRGCWQVKGAASGACSSFTLARALNLAILNNAQVLNLSLGGPHDALLSRLIDTALQRGMVVVAAAAIGDGEPAGMSFPASHPGVVAVASRGFAKAAGAVAGPLVAAGPLIAPGADILTTAPGGGYGVLSGSSLASAHVAGIVALIRERDATLSQADIVTRLRASAPGNRSSVNACRAVVQDSGARPGSEGEGDACAAVNLTNPLTQ